MFKELNFNEEKESTRYNRQISIFFIVLETLYIIGLLLGYSSVNIVMKDIIKLIMLIIIYFYFFIIMFSYFSFSLILFKIICTNFFKFKIGKKMNEYFSQSPKIPSINLFSYIINPYALKYYYNNENNKKNDDCYLCEKFYYESIIIIKLLSFIFSLICFIRVSIKMLDYWLDKFFFILFFLIINILSLTLYFPFGCRNRRTFGVCCCRIEEEKGNKEEKKKKCVCTNNIFCTSVGYSFDITHPYLVSLSIIITNIISILLLIGTLYTYFFRKEKNIYNEEQFIRLYPQNNNINTKNILLPNFCYSSVYDMPLQLFFPFINDAYYYGNINSTSNNTNNKINSSLDIEAYKKLFFDDSYDIEIRGNLIEKEKTIKMVQYNVQNKKNFLTILAIRGTSYNTDIYLDSQLYTSSVLLSLLSTFSLLTQKNSYTYKLIEYSMNISYRMFFRFLLIDQYMTYLLEAYNKNKYSFYNNVVIVGQSLGGGLAKLFGRYIGKQAISLSGPGINAFHSLWNYQGKSENFEISAIDLVPDTDLIPRVEVSEGTIYRIICKKGIFGCHGKELSFCEILIMCRNPIYDIIVLNLLD